MRVPTLIASLAAAALAGPAASQTEPGMTPGAFRSVELRNGGRVTVRHGASHAFTLREGNLDISRIEVIGDRLVIERCRDRCPRGYRLEVEVTAPAIEALAVDDGGMVRTTGDFPARAAVAVAVNSGGSIDARSLPAEQVSAAINQGGAIFVRAGGQLNASISNGGLVTYFGNARVQTAINGGGSVVRGDAEDIDRPLADLHPQPQPLAPLPILPVPPVPPVPPSRDY